MKHKRIYSFFKSEKREATCEHENMTNSSSSHILNHGTNKFV